MWGRAGEGEEGGTGVWGEIEEWGSVFGCGGGEGRYGEVWGGVKEGVGR